MMRNKGINIVEFTKGAKPLNDLKGKRAATAIERKEIVWKYCKSKAIGLVVAGVLACISLEEALRSFDIAIWYFALSCFVFWLSISVVATNAIGIRKRVKCSYSTVRCRMSKVDGSHNCIWLDSEEGETVNSWFVVSEGVVKAGRNDEPLLLVFGETYDRKVFGTMVLTEDQVVS